MKEESNKKYTIQAMIGIKGESFFESLISDYAIPNGITGSKDIGIDYICQWVSNNDPTWIMFAVQVKTFLEKNVKIKYVKENKGFNNLSQYTIHGSNLKIDVKTLNYWKTLGIPFYLFAVCVGAKELKCYYKRYSPTLTNDDNDLSKINFYSEFYKANENNKFIAFANPANKTGGFARDLFVDYIRCNYYKGNLIYLNPRTIGLKQFPDEENVIFLDLFQIYKNKILIAYNKTKVFLKRFNYIN